MKKKLVKVANQIMAIEEKLQAGENMNENLEKMEKLVNSLSFEDLLEVNDYLEKKLGIRINN